MNFLDYGWDPAMMPENADGIPARITAVSRDLFQFVCEQGSGLAGLKTTEYTVGGEVFPTAGDFVLLDWQPAGESRILKTLPRKTYFSRLDPSSSGHGEQAVAANFDTVFIMQSLNRDFNVHRLERYLTLAWQSGAVPAVVLTKADLVQDYTEQLRAAEKAAIGAEVFAVSVRTGQGLSDLAERLKPRGTVVFLGSSGVGKSSLVNALAGGNVIDTPGMRELGMWDVTDGIGHSFADVEKFFGQCRFSDCRHQSEPGCAVKAAIERGELSAERWESYCRLKNEAKYSEDKTGYLREKQQWHKNVAKISRSLRKSGRTEKW